MGTSSKQRRGPAWYRIVMLSATAFAIEFAYAVEAGYGTPALLKTGLNQKYASVMWAVGPVLNILFQGYMGSASDRCRCSWGRRRPFILGLAIAVCIALGLFPYGEILSGQVFHLSGGAHTTFVILFTSVAFVAMDFCLDMLQSPVRSYLLDSVPPERSERGNSIYSAMIGVGATIGAVISAIPWKKLGLASADSFEIQVKVVFGIAVGILIAAQLLTLCSVKEKRDFAYNELSVSSEDLENLPSAVNTSETDSSASDNQNSTGISSAENRDEIKTTNELVEPSNNQSSVVPISTDQSSVVSASTDQSSVVPSSTDQSSIVPTSMNQSSVVSASTDQLLVVPSSTDQSSVVPTSSDHSSVVPTSTDQSSVVPASTDESSEENLIGLESSSDSVTVQSKCSQCHCLNPVSCFKEIIGGFYGNILFVKYMSFTFFRLWVSVFFSWFSFLAMYLFFTTFVGEVVYGGSPDSEDEQLLANYDEGVIVGCAGLVALYFVSFIYSLLSEWITGCFGIRCVLTCAHLAYLVACGVVVLYPSVWTAMVMAGMAGVFFSLMISFPFALIPYYKSSGRLLRKPWPNASDTKGKAVAFILIAMASPQLILGSSMGSIISAFGSARIVVVVAFLGQCFATLSSMFITIKPASQDHRWTQLVKCLKCLKHGRQLLQVQEKNEVSEL